MMGLNLSMLWLLIAAAVLADEEWSNSTQQLSSILNVTLANDSDLLMVNNASAVGKVSVSVSASVSVSLRTTPTPPLLASSPVTFRASQRVPVPQFQHHHNGPRYGPYFEDGVDTVNLTARVGSKVLLDCKIGMLQDKTVTWVHRRQESINLLTVGRTAYSSDQRISLKFRYPNNWRLEILYVTRRDAGVYECQVATHPPRVKTVYLTVTAPEVLIWDEKRHETSEKYYKAGSIVELTCLARHIEQGTDIVQWRLGQQTISSGITFNKSLENNTVIATLTIEQGQRQHSGNYSCAVGDLATAVIAVHILNGELPAAVHGNCCPPRDPALRLTWALIFVYYLSQWVS